MVEEARLEGVDSRLAVSAGWFVVNAGDVAWLNDYFGGVCIFESGDSEVPWAD